MTDETGNFTYIAGPMFGGKTDELIRMVKKEVLGNRKKYDDKNKNYFMAFKPESDDRYRKDYIVSHDLEIESMNGNGKMSKCEGERLPAIQLPVNDEGVVPPESIYLFTELSRRYEPELVAFDEGQFWDELVVDAVRYLTEEEGIDVVGAGLDTNFRGEPFYTSGQLLAIADDKKGVQAKCSECGEEATKTQKLIDGEPAPYDSSEIDVGGAEKYGARCKSDHSLTRAPDIREKIIENAKQQIDKESLEEYFKKITESLNYS